jgi:hypothetical protein
MLEAGPPTAANPNWTYTYRFASQGGEEALPVEHLQEDDQVISFDIPIAQPKPPGIRGRLRVETRFWNHWQG